jgi:Na+/H+ antiporter NhaC
MDFALTFMPEICAVIGAIILVLLVGGAYLQSWRPLAFATLFIAMPLAGLLAWNNNHAHAARNFFAGIAIFGVVAALRRRQGARRAI